jgi:cytochrome c
MKQIAATFVALTALTSTVLAADPVTLAKEKQCFACHSVDKERQAPSFVLLARNYRNASNADRMLERKVVSGGLGHWGTEPMPAAGPRPAVSEDEARELVAWILSLK